MTEKTSRSSQVIVYRGKDGDLSMDQIPPGSKASDLIAARSEQGFVPVTTCTQDEASSLVNANTQRKKLIRFSIKSFLRNLQ